jgi:predicted glutamine amidotransferase
MCIAIYKPENNIISKETLAQCFKSNSDGAGFMFVNEKQLHTNKGFFTFDSFWDAWEPHQNKQAVLHFRIKTHGAISVDNCHPFNINKGLAFVHNGIISGYGSEKESDTKDFGDKILQPLVAKWGNLSLFQPAIKSLLEARIGYSKLIFLDRHGNHDIFNENKGVWDNGVWYSNSSYKPYVATYSTKEYVPPQSTAYKPSALTVKSQGKSAAQVLETGELVALRIPHYDTDTNTLWRVDDVFEVVAVNMDFTADLMADNTDLRDPAIVYNVPFRKFDFYEVPEKEVTPTEDPIKSNIYTFEDYHGYDA